MGQALLGDVHIAPDLTVQHLLHIPDVHGLGKFHDFLHGQAVGAALLLGSLQGLFQHDLTVPADLHHIGVVPGDAAEAGVPVPGQGDADIKQLSGPGLLHSKLCLLQIPGDLQLLVVRDLGDHQQLLFRLARHDARGSSGLKSVEPAGVGDDDALDILDDIAADNDLHPFRSSRQLPGRQCRGIGHGDGLGTAHGRYQLPPEDLHKFSVFFHTDVPHCL